DALGAQVGITASQAARRMMLAMRWSVSQIYIGILLVILAVAVLAGVSYVMTSTFVSAWVFGYGEGHPPYAETWRQRLEPPAHPEEGRARYPEVVGKRLKNGEWIFGVCADSHGSHWGGTIVVKDSTGKVRAFFGHVCGPSYLENILSYKGGSLKEFYDELTTTCRFHEYNF